jgi:hypothetical protein
MDSASPCAAGPPAIPLPGACPASRLVLAADEAAFIDAAMARFFPGSIEAPDGSFHVDRKLHDVLHSSDSEPASEVRGVTLALYRSTIHEVQAYCLRVYDRRFQSLCPREQDVVLMLLEEGCQQMQVLFEMLLNDATEVFLTQALWPFQE